jgi:hypothetical protein
MSIMQQFKLTSADGRKDTSPIGRFRRRLAKAVELQIDLANAEIAGQPFERTRKHWAHDKATGARELKHLPVRVRPWWQKVDGGRIQLKVRYGAKVLELAPGMNAIELGATTELPTQLSLICDAIRAGELDACAGVAASGRPVPAPKANGRADKKAAHRRRA